MSERRKRDRKATLHIIRVLNRDTGKQIGRLVNITTDGMMLITKKPIDRGTIIPVRMVLPWMIHDKEELEFSAEVRWCRPDTNPNYEAVGFRLLNVSREGTEIIEAVFHEFHLVG